MSVTDQGGWGEVERRAKVHERELRLGHQLTSDAKDMLSLVTITTEDRLRGAVCEALSLLEQGHPTAAHQVLQDALKIGGVK